MTHLRVLATRIDGGVTVIVPSPRCVRVLHDGGGIYCVAHAPRLGPARWGLSDWLKEHSDAATISETERTGYLPLDLARAWEINKLVRDPMWRPDRPDREDFAAQWIDGLIHGGYAERDAVLLIGEYSRPSYSTALELVTMDDIPKDRRYRDAWRRSSNGGPIWIDEDKAREIDEIRMWEAYEHGKAA